MVRRVPLMQVKIHSDHVDLCSHSLENKEQGCQFTFRNALFVPCQIRILATVSQTSLRTYTVRERGLSWALSFFEKNHCSRKTPVLTPGMPNPKIPSGLHTPVQRCRYQAAHSSEVTGHPGTLRFLLHRTQCLVETVHVSVSRPKQVTHTHELLNDSQTILFSL